MLEGAIPRRPRVQHIFLRILRTRPLAGSEPVGPQELVADVFLGGGCAGGCRHRRFIAVRSGASPAPGSRVTLAREVKLTHLHLPVPVSQPLQHSAWFEGQATPAGQQHLSTCGDALETEHTDPRQHSFTDLQLANGFLQHLFVGPQMRLSPKQHESGPLEQLVPKPWQHPRLAGFCTLEQIIVASQQSAAVPHHFSKALQHLPPVHATAPQHLVPAEQL